MYDVIVIGGGAAGTIAAGRAASRGKKVCLLEKNPLIGKKILITGKGRCNFTNASDVNNHIANCPVNGKFITNALYRFDAEKTIAFFQELGVQSKIERGNRVFPESDKAKDIVSALEKYLRLHQVEVIKDDVQNLAKIKDVFIILGLNNQRYEAEKIIIATGGKSYPGTGSTGDGYRFAKKLGHTINLLTPSLVPMETAESWVTEMQGLSLKNVEIRILNKNDKLQYQDFGEMIFTHYGISGPIILSASSHLRVINNLILEIDLKPALDEMALDKRLLRDIAENSNRQLNNLLKELLPAKMIPVIIRLSGIAEDRVANSIRKEERKVLINLLKHLRMTLTGFRPVKEAIITSGGICVDEIEPRTMESRIEPGLFFAGEIIDVDAYTGGYNLQIAFSTGFVAGDNV
ncbi:MAG: NAD(P)/FAD-dependent oxidoreductase [Candidatus Cloacimonetes bacterium]|nr:NAD(P)/FAD-dependent oxidoreductase [Candidatus Cloacimonadota bacterium]